MGNHNTQRNKARKMRIRENEYRRMVQRIRKIEAMTDEHKAAIKKLMIANARGEMVSASNMSNWRDLREMGILREAEGKLTLTAIGMQVAADEK
jgi:hypothetical protein